ncbi:unnamed protein product [Oikopleura dioica]|uniref:Oikosin 26 n=1 Tax=Oikopleura dioica TaxID=34765 RepID=E4XAC4_OIKDI|nr:unnamed protein product [Oikopleura dioica]CCG47866.1 oikosin 26 [Oikopleura dioica]
MKLFGLILAGVSAVTWQEMFDRQADFVGRLYDNDQAALASRYARVLDKANHSYDRDLLNVDGCENVWGLDDDAEDAFDPESATDCAYGRKIARNFLRKVKMQLCLDGLNRGGKSTKKKIEKRFARVVEFTRNNKFCQE